MTRHVSLLLHTESLDSSMSYGLRLRNHNNIGSIHQRCAHIADIQRAHIDVTANCRRRCRLCQFLSCTAVIRQLHMLLQKLDVLEDDQTFATLITQRALRMFELRMRLKIGRRRESLTAIFRGTGISAQQMCLSMTVEYRLRFETFIADITDGCSRFSQMSFHMHFQHAGSLEGLVADLALWVLLAVRSYPVGMRVHVILQTLVLLELLSTEITDISSGG